MVDEIKVSVAMITYNHEQFIAQAIESALNQERSFPIEIVIGDDCSLDNTRQILEEYRTRFPDLIRLLDRPQNLGMLRNFQSTIESCTGQYIALLEGDDYWTSSQKLSQQVAFLDQNQEFAICHHNAQAVYQDERTPRPWHAKRVPARLRLDDMFVENRIVTCTTMFRNRLFDFPDWFTQSPVGDWPLHLLNARHGDAGYLDEVMSAYRIHESSNWSQLSRLTHLERMIKTLDLVSQDLPQASHAKLGFAQRRRHAEYVEILVNQGDLKSARDHSKQHIDNSMVFERAQLFHQALQQEAQGDRKAALRSFQQALQTESELSHITSFDVELARFRCRFPRSYSLFRNIWRRLR